MHVGRARLERAGEEARVQEILLGEAGRDVARPVGSYSHPASPAYSFVRASAAPTRYHRPRLSESALQSYLGDDVAFERADGLGEMHLEIVV